MTRIKLFSIAFLSVLVIACVDAPITYTAVTGTWRCQDTDPMSYVSPYFVDITKRSTNDGQYILENFFNVDINEPIMARLSGDSILIETEQIISSTIVKSGYGIVSDDYKKIVFTYIVYDDKGERTITASYTR